MIFSRLRKNNLVKAVLIFSMLFQGFAFNPSYAAQGDGERQDVLQRTMQYARGVDLVEVNRQVRSDWVRPRNNDKGAGSVDGNASKCDGYTVSDCGLPCCGKRECELICTKNNTIAHGDEMCLSSVQTSECGMSCCGPEDCKNVCLNYRIEGNCDGYTKTPDGKDCCGYDDCRSKACGSYTSVITASGQKEACCGKENCEKVKCEYQLQTTGQWGGQQGLRCCGRDQCYKMECGGLTSVDSKVDPEKTNLPCCGVENCQLTACDGYVTVQSPEGLKECCGYEDCHNKECNNQTHTVSVSGKEYACCGGRDCYIKSCDNYTTGLLTEVCCGYEQCIEDQCTYTKRFGSSQEPFEIRMFLHPEDMNKQIYVSFGAEECATFLVNGQKPTEYHYNWPGCSTGYNRPNYILYDLSNPDVRQYFREGVNWIRGTVFNPDSDKNMEFKGCANFETFINMRMNTWETDTGPKHKFNGSSYEAF